MDSYAPHIVSLVDAGCSVSQLSQHLTNLATQTIGVEARTEQDDEIAEEIIRMLRREFGDRP
jgi:hypothetical protein